MVVLSRLSQLLCLCEQATRLSFQQHAAVNTVDCSA